MVSDLLQMVSQIPWLSDNQRVRRWEIIGVLCGLPVLGVGIFIFVVSTITAS
jgi:hypothetical protein